MDLRTISNMAARYGISPRTLRFYEQRGLISPHRDNLVRLYSPHDEVRLRIILKAKRLGFSLSEIERLLFRDDKSRGATSDVECTGASDFYDRLTIEQVQAQIEVLLRQRADIESALDELRRLERILSGTSKA